jgi:hypothetical protein
MLALEMPPRVFATGDHALLPELVGKPASIAAWLTKVTDELVIALPKAPNMGRICTGCGRRDRGVRVAHGRGGDAAAEQHHVGLHAEEGRVPQHQIGALADFDRADLLDMPWAMAGLMVYLAM